MKNSLFHVKPAMPSLAALCLAAGMVPAVHAAIHKCTAPDGKVVFGDQPCAPGQAAAIVKPAAAAPAASPSGGMAPPDPNAGLKSMRNRMEQALTPECRAMQQRMAAAQAPGGQPLSDAGAEALLAQFESRCAPLMRAAQQAQWEQDRLAAEKSHACEAKRRALRDRAPQRASMDAAQRQALDAVQKEVDRDCR